MYGPFVALIHVYTRRTRVTRVRDRSHSQYGSGGGGTERSTTAYTTRRIRDGAVVCGSCVPTRKRDAARVLKHIARRGGRRRVLESALVHFWSWIGCERHTGGASPRMRPRYMVLEK